MMGRAVATVAVVTIGALTMACTADGEPSGGAQPTVASVRSSPSSTAGDGEDETSPPTTGSVEVIEVGDGPAVTEGDWVLLGWEMAAWSTEEVVESTTDDFGGPVPVQLGSGRIPVALDAAVTDQTVGSRLQVVFERGMVDLPPVFDADDAYVLEVEIVDQIDEEDVAEGFGAPDETSQAAPTTVAPSTGPSVPTEGPLSASVPTGTPLPSQNSFAAVRGGDGPAADEGDTLLIDYVMVSWSTGEVVASSAEDDDGPISIVLGDIEVPRVMESALFGQSAGSRIQVIYAPDLFDLPEGLDADDAYLVAVDLLEVG